MSLKYKLFALIIAVCVILAAANVRVVRWDKPADLDRRGHSLPVDWMYCVWFGEHILWCDSGTK